MLKQTFTKTTVVFWFLFLFLLLLSHTCTSYTFYLNQTEVSLNNKTETHYCNSEDNPCSSYCEIVKYINSINYTTPYTLIEIYFMRDYDFKRFSEICEITVNGAFQMHFKKSPNATSEINVNFAHQAQLYYNVIDTKFHSLILNNLHFYCNRIYFDNCTLNNFINIRGRAGNTLHFKNSNIISPFNSNSKIDAAAIVIVSDCNFYGDFTVFNAQHVAISNSKFFNNLDIKNCMNVKLTSDEFGEFSTAIISYTGSTSLTDVKFYNTNSLGNPLTVKFCPQITITQCEAITKYKFALLTGSDYISINNLITTGSVEILLTDTVEVQNSQFNEVDHLGLRVMDAKTLNLFNVNFTKCNLPLLIENGNSRNISAKINSSYFIENKSENGAGFALVSTVGTLEINNCQFISNEAKYSGGAVFINLEVEIESSMSINNCKFIGNTAGLDQPKTSIHDGNGGALAVVGAPISLSSNTLFSENKALRGGAIYTNSLIVKPNATFINNVGKVSGNILFSNNIETLQNVNNFVKNSAEISSNIYTTKLFFNVENEWVDNITIFSSQTFTVVVRAFDMLGNLVTQIYEPYEFVENSNRGFQLIEASNSNFGEYKYLFLQLANYTFDSTKEVKDKFSIMFQKTRVTVDLTIIGCPSGWREVIFGNYNYCERIEFPISVIIVLSILGAILFFLIGIGVGILLIYIIVKIMIKLKRLEKKEKAELEIERKIIDKKIVFGDSSEMDIPLLGADMDEKKIEKKANRDEKFIIPVEEIILESKIGEGGCGTVYSAKWGDNVVAIKTIRVSDASEEEEEDFEREVSLLSSLRHPNIVSFYGVTITEKSKYMVIEYLSKGSLKQAIYYSKIGKEVLSLQKKLNILIGISQGMNYLHTLKPNAIIHRDLKPENVLLDSNGVCKVCDFGLSKIIGTATQTMTTNVGTLFYLSPEMLKGDNPSSITSKLDVYSFAIIMWELFFEESPYHNSSSNKINYFNHSSELPSNDNIFLIPSLVAKGLRPVIPFTTEEEKEIWVNEFIIPFENSSLNNKQVFNIVDSYIQLMKECWSLNPNERPFFSEILTRLQETKNLVIG